MTTKNTTSKAQAAFEKAVKPMAKPSANRATSHMPSQHLPERWFLVDVEGKIMGRAATKIAKLLMGKDHPAFNPGVDAKTNVIVINADKVKLSGNKMEGNTYYKHTGYLGGIRETTPAKILEGKKPTDLVTRMVYGMLPKNKLRHVMMNRLRVFVGTEHPHNGQNPVIITL